MPIEKSLCRPEEPEPQRAAPRVRLLVRWWLCLLACALACGCGAARAQEAEEGVARGRAVIVGVNNYDDKTLKELTFAAGDAKMLSEALSEGNGALFEPSRVRLLSDNSDRKPTLAQMRESVKWLSEAGPDEVALFYFSGHGDVYKGRQFLAPSDVSMKDLAATGFDVERDLNSVLQEAARNGLQRVVVIFDCCHSGLQTASPTLAAPDRPETNIDSLLSPENGRVTLAACEQSQRSWEDPQISHGVYSYFLSKGLRGEADTNGDGKVCASELHFWAHDAVLGWAKARGLIQTPRWQANVASDIALTRCAPKARQVVRAEQLSLQLFQPRWEGTPGSSDFVVECRPNEKIDVVGLARSPGGLTSIEIDGRAISLGNLGARDMGIISISQGAVKPSKASTPVGASTSTGASSVTTGDGVYTRFTGQLEVGAAPRTAVITITDASGVQRPWNLHLRPSAQAVAAGGKTTVAVIGLSRQQVNWNERFRDLGVGMGLTQDLIRAAREREQWVLIDEKSEVAVGLAKEAWLQQDAAFDQSTVVQYGKLLGARYVLYGEVFRFYPPRRNRGKLLMEVSARLVDVQTRTYRQGFAEVEAKVQAAPGEVEVDGSTLSAVSREAFRKALADLLAELDRHPFVQLPTGLTL